MAQGGRAVVLASAPRTQSRVPETGGVVRRALLQRLDEVVTSRFGLVVGPPGSGKTTVMAQWSRTTGLPVVWGRCTRAGVVVRAPGAGAATCLTPQELGRMLLTDGPARVSDRLAGRGTSASGSAADHVSDRGVDRATDRSALLVLDDAHELIGHAAERDLEQLLLDVLPGVHVLVGSRVRPRFNLARSEISPPTVLAAADLRLRPWEVDRLFRDVYDEPLTSEDVETVSHETGGWAVAVHLFHRATAGLLPADRRRAVRGLPVDSWYAHDYLTGEILAGLDRPLVDLLHWGSAFDRMTGARCDALMATSGSRECLRDLEVRWSLAATDDGVHYTLPRVLRRHLLTVQTEHLGSAASSWQRRAARILEDERAYVAASEAYRRAGDDEDVHRLQDRVTAATTAGRGRVEAWVVGRPAAGTTDATGANGARGVNGATGANGTAGTTGATGANGTAGTTGMTNAAGPVGPPAGPVSTWEGVVRAATHRDPVAAVPAAGVLTGAERALAEGLCLLLAGNQRAAREPLRRAAADPDGSAGVVLGATLVDATLTGSSRASMLTTADRVHADAERRGLTWLARMAHGVVVALDGTERARADVAALVAHCDRIDDPWGAALIASWSGLVALSQGVGDPDEWEALVRRWHALDAAVPAVWARACYALTAAEHQLPEAVEDARSAEAFARSAAVPGALAVAYAALAAGAQDGPDSGELVALARSTADEHGVDLRRLRLGVTGTSVRRPTTSAPGRRGTAPAAVDDERPTMRLQCLGEFRVVVDGAPVDLSVVRPRARSALRFLALHAGRPVHREQLADALWGELDPTAAMHNLHVSISAVRRALEPSVPTRSSRFILRDGETYTLVLGPGAVCDHVEFDRACKEAARARVRGDLDTAAARWREALDLYAGNLLPEDGPADWVVGPRDRVRALAAEAAADLAEVELEAGRFESAVAAATRSIELDECRDHAWRLLVAALTAAGDTAAAHRAHRGYTAMLDDLGVLDAPRRTGSAALAGRVTTVGSPTPLPRGAGATAELTSARGTPPPRSPRSSPGSPGTSR
ncbi:BTAD domain-containing putative transcriptional regulator [Cellulomonas sp. URHB0016]